MVWQAMLVVISYCNMVIFWFNSPCTVFENKMNHYMWKIHIGNSSKRQDAESDWSLGSLAAIKFLLCLPDLDRAPSSEEWKIIVAIFQTKNNVKHDSISPILSQITMKISFFSLFFVTCFLLHIFGNFFICKCSF